MFGNETRPGIPILEDVHVRDRTDICHDLIKLSAMSMRERDRGAHHPDPYQLYN
jgi:hypothetical protein